ncbi:hypothetical protein STEG23_008058, partial [Scotinomys teguina]
KGKSPMSINKTWHVKLQAGSPDTATLSSKELQDSIQIKARVGRSYANTPSVALPRFKAKATETKLGQYHIYPISNGITGKVKVHRRSEASYLITQLAVMEAHLEQYLYQPQKLLEDLRNTDAQQFRTAMKCLLEDKWDHLDLTDTVIHLGDIWEEALQSPGVNRTLFVIILERCFQVLNPLECVEVLGRVLRGSSGSFLQPDVTERLPQDLHEDAFKNLSAVFKDLYDQTSAHTQRALYSWMTGILRTPFNITDGSVSWVSAEKLWILGRYMVHLPLEEIMKISPVEIGLFISYDNATKQLDTVYDVTPELAQAFLERIRCSSFDMRNISTIHRQGGHWIFLIFGPRAAEMAQLVKCLASKHGDLS